MVTTSKGSQLRTKLQAEEMDSLVSELAAVASEEKALIEECRDLLCHTQNLQVRSYSLVLP